MSRQIATDLNIVKGVKWFWETTKFLRVIR
jgi:hypothetical protein